MIKEDSHEILTKLEMRREISKLKSEVKRKEKIIERLKEKIKRLEKR